KGYGSVGIGNILGANILDLLLVLGIPAAIRGYEVSSQTSMIDMPIGLGVMALLFVPILIKKRAYRWQGALLLLIYAGYCAMTFMM
ncbi:MAG: sodium:calcium antiporter, partial [Lachnospiraceae bacterium]|nr:sodium:calcium antiporter [Lachnospiraceae bacterium]